MNRLYKLATALSLISSLVIIKTKNDQIKELQKEVKWRIELTRTQEEWLRSCGFYGSEELKYSS